MPLLQLVSKAEITAPLLESVLGLSLIVLRADQEDPLMFNHQLF